MKKLFKVNIETTNLIQEWEYKPKTKIEIPVYTNNKYNALRKVENRCCGSEYPPYKVLSIEEYDSFLFEPIL